MWREIIFILVGIWLVVFAFLNIEPDSADVALTVWTGLVVLALGIWGVMRIQRAERQRREAEAGERVGITAPPENTRVIFENEPPAGYRGFSRERDPTDLLQQ